MAESEAMWIARVTLLDPYPEAVFTPLTDDEVRTCVAALTACGVRNASDRLHASWARHLYGVAQYIDGRDDNETLGVVGVKEKTDA